MVRVHDGVLAVPRSNWDAVVGAAPGSELGLFQDHRFLAALEASGSVTPASGWTPFALVATRAGAPGVGPVGVAAAYLTERATHPAFTPLDRERRPRLLLAPPFTPVPGPRLWTHPTLAPHDAARVRVALLTRAVELARDRDACGVHLLDCGPDDLSAAAALGFARRVDRHYAWHNTGDPDFETWLDRLSAHRRANIRRERRRVREAGVTLQTFRGGDVRDEHLVAVHALHAATASRFIGGRAHVDASFFSALGDALRDQLVVTLALHDGRPIAGALDFEKADRRFGRYWGSALEVDALYFEVCAYAPIADCLARGLHSFHVGPGGRTHKLARGLLPVAAHSAHLLFDPTDHAALARDSARQARRVRDDIEHSRVRVFIR